MNGKNNKKTTLGWLKSVWNSLPNVLKLLTFVSTILAIIIALKTLFPATPCEIDFFDANPEAIEPGENFTLRWCVTGATKVTIEPGIGEVDSRGTLTLSPAKTTTYEILASDGKVEKVDYCTVTVKETALEIKIFEASPDTLEEGESSILSWSVSGCSKVLIEPEVGSKEPIGTISVSPSKTTTYKLTVSDGGKKEVKYCTVVVKQEVLEIKSFKANPEFIESGEDSTLSWLVSGASRVTIEPDIGPVEYSGISVVSPSETTIYKLTAYDDGKEETAYCTVAVESGAPDIKYFESSLDVIEEGESSTLSWSVSGASKVTIKPELGNVAFTDSRPVSPGKTTTYTLEAVNGDETVTETTQVRLLYTAEYEQVKYAYQEGDWYGKKYTVVELLGEKYAPLKDTSRNKLAGLVIDDATKYAIRTGEAFDLGNGYALGVKQIDVEGDRVWLEFTKDGDFVDDELIIGTGSTWEVKLNNIEGENDVVVLRVHVNQVFQGAVDSIVQIQGIWLIDFDDAFTLQDGDKLPGNEYYVWESGYDYIKYTEV
ncbi:hypothetical protein FTO70_04165 [Methanosarcina sp. KYL-1]|uniref:S-layer protein domain-containing protein n=1 Tax=Methanosarcina sp. KYL-1 TaxID=2602068 RepID=UPI0021007570|nr:S-layer protein domain-containing protein [Methanosarcina sp. KYL-1]MCQ1534897.1 hypothetical protein [Methanosarcina sp. KYL-1]